MLFHVLQPYMCFFSTQCLFCSFSEMGSIDFSDSFVLLYFSFLPSLSVSFPFFLSFFMKIITYSLNCTLQLCVKYIISI